MAVSAMSALEEIRRGAMPPSEVLRSLEGADAAEFTTELRRDYPLIVQNREFREKREVGLARNIRFVEMPPTSSDSGVQDGSVYCDCVFVVAEQGRITGLSVLGEMTLRSKTFDKGAIVESSKGFQLFSDLGEWRLKPIGDKTLSFNPETLRKFGWQFTTQPQAGDCVAQLFTSADSLAAKGRLDESIPLYRQAAELERRDLESLAPDKTLTRGALAVSHASLLYKARDFVAAGAAISEYLARGDLLPGARKKLEELRDFNAAMLRVAGRVSAQQPEGRPQETAELGFDLHSPSGNS